MNVNLQQATMPVSGVTDFKPESLDYKAMKKSMIRGERRTIKLQPAINVNSYSYSNNREIEFNLPAVGFIDNKNTTLVFTAQSINPSDDPKLNIFTDGIEGIFNKIEINLGDGSKNIENLQNYNYNAISEYKFRLTRNTLLYAEDQMGFVPDPTAADDADFQTAALGKQYAVPLMAVGLFDKTQQYLPCGVLAKSAGFSRSFTMKIFLENPEICMYKLTGSSDPLNYVITNVYLQMELIDCPDYEMELVNKIKSGNMVLSIPMKTSDLFVQQIPQATKGQLSLFFNTYRKYLTGAKVIFLPTPTNAQDTDLIYNWEQPGGGVANKLGFQNYQFLIGNRYYPTQPAEVDPLLNTLNNIFLSGSVINELAKYLNITKQWHLGYNVEATDPKNFMIAQTFQTFYDNQLYMNDSEMFLDGIDTNTTSQIILNIQKDANEDTANTTVLAFLEYIQVIVVDKDGAKIIR